MRDGREWIQLRKEGEVLGVQGVETMIRIDYVGENLLSIKGKIFKKIEYCLVELHKCILVFSKYINIMNILT